MSTLLAPDRTRLLRLAMMTTSTFSGERDAAILAVLRMLKQLGLTWNDIIVQPGPIAKQSTDRNSDIEIAIRHIDLLSDWEKQFVVSLRGFRRLSPKQCAVLHSIVERVASGGRAT